MGNKASTKKYIFIFILAFLTMIFLSGSLLSFADTYTTIYADGSIYASGKLKLTDTDGTRYATSDSSDFTLPYLYSATNTVLNMIPYSDIFTNGAENINVNEIGFNFFVVFDEAIKSNTFIRVKMTYRYQPGRASKLNFEKLLNDGQLGIVGVKGSGTANEVLAFDDINIIDSSVNEISQSSYIYNLEFEFRVPNNRNMYAFEVFCPTVVVNQTLNSATTNANPMIFGLQNAEVLLNTTDNINREDVENAQNEANRLDDELGNAAEDLKVTTPAPDDLLSDADPFGVVSLEDFTSFGDVFSFIKDNGLVTGLISLTFIFVLFKYVLFGKG